MIRTVIIEDEKIIADAFKNLLLNTSTGTEVLASCSTVRESVDYLSKHEPPDLIFSDVQLSDGLSFDIFNQVNINSPVVFVTGYDNFLLNAFEHNGIDYLLKPVEEKELEKALNRYKTLEQHFANHHSFVNGFRRKTKSRLMVRKGIEHVSLRTEDIAFLYTEDKIVYVTDKNGKKYLADQNLTELEQELDRALFFRANRQYIVNIESIRSYKSYERVKLQVDIAVADTNRPVIISQEMAGCFRKWIDGL
jgi:DNA-binding LytR/AlgR family response regulator